MVSSFLKIPNLVLKYLILKAQNLYIMYVCPSVRLPVRPSVRLSVRPSVRLSVRPSVRPSVCPSVRLSVCLSVCLSHLRSAGSAERTSNKELSSVPRTLYVFNRSMDSEVYSYKFMIAPAYALLLMLSGATLRCLFHEEDIKLDRHTSERDINKL